ncbi:MAG: hypothetical protein KBS76_04485 [Ruminococcus sp.]|nr:hypothetical protein [Candidatus Apopatosoma intestinale]
MFGFLLSAILSTVFFLIVQLKKGGAVGAVAKSVASLCFVALGACMLDGGPSRAGLFLLYGLVLGLVGDILLGVNIPDAGACDWYLFGGIGTFALEHIAVVAAVILASGFSLSRLLIACAVGAVMAGALSVTEWKILRFDFGSALVPAMGYAFILASAFVYYLLTAFASPAYAIIAVGMALFLLSDVVLSFMLFGKKDTPLMSAVNLTTYYAGQILFALSIGSALIA